MTLPAPRLPTPECLMTALQQGGNSPCLPGSCCVPWGVASLRASQRLAAGLSSSCGRWPGHTGHTCTPTLLVSCNQEVCPAGGVGCTCGTFGRVWALFCIGWRQCSCAQIRWNSLGTQWCNWRPQVQPLLSGAAFQMLNSVCADIHICDMWSPFAFLCFTTCMFGSWTACQRPWQLQHLTSNSYIPNKRELSTYQQLPQICSTFTASSDSSGNLVKTPPR